MVYANGPPAPVVGWTAGINTLHPIVGRPVGVGYATVSPEGGSGRTAVVLAGPPRPSKRRRGGDAVTIAAYDRPKIAANAVTDPRGGIASEHHGPDVGSGEHGVEPHVRWPESKPAPQPRRASRAASRRPLRSEGCISNNGDLGSMSWAAMGVDIDPAVEVNAVNRVQRLHMLSVTHQHRGIAKVEPDAVERAIAVVIDVAWIIVDHIERRERFPCEIRAAGPVLIMVKRKRPKRGTANVEDAVIRCRLRLCEGKQTRHGQSPRVEAVVTGMIANPILNQVLAFKRPHASVSHGQRHVLLVNRVIILVGVRRGEAAGGHKYLIGHERRIVERRDSCARSTRRLREAGARKITVVHKHLRDRADCSRGKPFGSQCPHRGDPAGRLRLHDSHAGILDPDRPVEKRRHAADETAA